MSMEAEVGWMRQRARSTAKDHWCRDSEDAAWHGLCLGASRQSQPLRHPGFRMLAPRTVGEYTSVVSSQQVCGDLSRQPQQTMPLPFSGLS